MQADEAAYLALGLLKHPEKPLEGHMHRFATSAIFRALYGGDAIAHLGPDPSKKIEDITVRIMAAAMPQNSIVDTFPFLKPVIRRVKWLRKEADNWWKETDDEGFRLYEGAVPGDAWDATTIVGDLNSNSEKYGLSKRDAVWMTIALYMAGQETTRTGLCAAVLAMLHFPAVIKAAQAQIDAVCGSRPPTFEDSDKLAYIHALALEAVRWKPPVPASILHAASEDFTYEGYVIPKGAIIVDNLWSQTRDESVYPDPEKFDPTRFLDSDGNVSQGTIDTHHGLLGFGHGRRVCPGRDFALNSMFIACAYVLWAFDFEWPVDENGKQMICGVDEMVDHAIAATPRPFEVVVKPRHEGLEEMLLAVLK